MNNINNTNTINNFDEEGFKDFLLYHIVNKYYSKKYEASFLKLLLDKLSMFNTITRMLLIYEENKFHFKVIPTKES